MATYSTCMNTNTHNITFPLCLTRSTPNHFLKSQVLKKNVTAVFSLWVLKSCINQNLHPGRPSKAKGIFHRVFLWDVHPEGKVERHTGWRSGIERERERDVKAWKCIVVYGEPFPHRDEWGLSESEKAGRAGIERCLCPTGRARGVCFPFFPPALPALVDAKGGGEGGSLILNWQSTGWCSARTSFKLPWGQPHALRPVRVCVPQKKELRR